MQTGLIQAIKEGDQDFEFYPTTQQIIEVINQDIHHLEENKHTKNFHYSILDVGAGNGNFFKILESLNPEEKDERGYVKDRYSFTKYAIEKSSILINSLDADIYIIGTDFHQQSLIDKKVDIIFCNPPYSEFESWAKKIITEANCSYIYLVIPERWEKNKELQEIIKRRKIEYKVLGNFDFLEADRPARAKVDIIRFDLAYISYHNNDPKSDPFEIWFDSFFKIDAMEGKYYSEYEEGKSKKEKIQDEIVKGQNLIDRLEELYRKDMDKLLNNYKALESLDYSIFKELGVNIPNLKEGLKLKIKGIKNLYWQELFDHLNTITDRLTKNSREKLLKKLTKNTNIDFTADNAYAIVLWAIKNANFYFDEQLKEIYLWMSCSENVKNYKSNSKFIEDGWRFNCELREGKYTHYVLDYRLVLKCYSTFNGYSCDLKNGLNINVHEKINDIITIAKNLGFTVNESTMNYLWKPGKENIFTFGNDSEEFMRVRIYKNGNIHCKFNQKFMKKLNIEAGRLNGWIKSPVEAAEEMEIDLIEVEELYKTNIQIPLKDVKLLI